MERRVDTKKFMALIREIRGPVAEFSEQLNEIDTTKDHSPEELKAIATSLSGAGAQLSLLVMLCRGIEADLALDSAD